MIRSSHSIRRASRLGVPSYRREQGTKFSCAISTTIPSPTASPSCSFQDGVSYHKSFGSLSAHTQRRLVISNHYSPPDNVQQKHQRLFSTVSPSPPPPKFITTASSTTTPTQSATTQSTNPTTAASSGITNNTHYGQLISLISCRKFENAHRYMQFIFHKTNESVTSRVFLAITNALYKATKFHCDKLNTIQACRTAEIGEAFLHSMVLFHRQKRLNGDPMQAHFKKVLQMWVMVSLLTRKMSISIQGNAAVRAEKLLRATTKLCQQGILPFQVDTTMFNIVLNAYAIQCDAEGAQNIFDQMKEINVEADAVTWTTLTKACTGSQHPGSFARLKEQLKSMDIEKFSHHQDMTRPYNLLMNAYATQGDEKGTQAVFDQMKEINVEADGFSWTALVKAYCQSNAPGSLERAKELLKSMDRVKFSGKDISVSYNLLMNAYATQGDEEGAQAVFDQMKESNVEADGFSGAALVKAYCQSKTPGSLARAKELLKSMDRVKFSGKDITLSYNLLMNAYATQGDEEGAQALFDQMKESNVEADGFSWTTLVKAYCQSNKPGSLDRALTLMTCIPGERDPTLYTHVMNAFATQGDGDGARAVFDQMNKDFLDGKSKKKPDIFQWSTLVKAYARSKKPGSFQIARELLTSMPFHANTVSYTSMMNGLASSGKAQEAESVLELMYEDYVRGNANAKPNTMVFNMVLNTWAQKLKLSNCDDATGKQATARRVEKILLRMTKLYKEKGLPVRPDNISYNTVIKAYGESGMASDAERVLESMYADYKSGNKSAKVNIVSFLSVVNAWAHSKDEKAGDRVESILTHMIGLHAQGVLEDPPDTLVYNAVVKTWGNLNNAEKVMDSFNKILNDFSAGILKEEPGLDTFLRALAALSRCSAPDTGEMADTILGKMIAKGLVPPAPCYALAIKCWSKGKGQEKAEIRMARLHWQLRNAHTNSNENEFEPLLDF